MCHLPYKSTCLRRKSNSELVQLWKTPRKMETPFWLNILLNAFQLTFGCLGIVSNTLQIVLISRSRDRQKVFTMTLLSLSIADLIASIMASFIAFCSIFEALDIAKLKGSEFAGITGFAFSNGSSSLHILFIAIQRLCIVMFPLRFKRIFTTFRAKLALASIWSLSAAFTLIYCFFHNLFLKHSSYALVADSIIMALLYGLLCYKIQKQQQERRRILNSTQKKSMRIFMHSVAVLAAFMLCTLPYAVIYITPLHGFEKIGNEIGWTMLTLNPFLDSLLYFLSSYCKNNKILMAKDGNKQALRGNTSRVTENIQENDFQTTVL